ncbi:Rab family GTPase [Aspergillus ruber CBS 135680]|uniref:Putative ras-like GTP-binding protein n=1 Tax=Aspergillus ruber (strain CBS 135680) TaxID=1388766 RepID=A0A017S368_ASPRC|nr:putative ras-like GTP-binding protein [Aspergillus ruber CBS 135680]EYE90610.1 putative ras-like GTP-binding protein [Aspergillus ruber CBS 135680]
MSSSLEAKIVVLGSQGVGKTSLVHRYVQNTFSPTTTTPTLGASFITQRILDRTSDTIVRLQIWDTAGQERFRSISRLYYRGAHACLLCYDITDEKSFEEMAGWLKELKDNLTVGDDGEGIVIHVVGTKSDVVALDPSRRRVPFERTIAYVAEQLYPTQASTLPATASATPTTSTTSFMHRSSSTLFLQSADSKRSSGFWGQDIGWDCCHEISAKDGEGIEEVFRVIARKLVEQRHRREIVRSSGPLAMSLSSGGASSSRGLGVDGNGAFRLGPAGPGGAGGDAKRRSWLGISSSSVTLDAYGEEQLEGRKKGKCC